MPPLMSLTSGLTYQDKGKDMTSGRVVIVPANFGTLGSRPKYRSNTHINGPMTPDPTIQLWNRSAPFPKHGRVVSPQSQTSKIAQSSPPGPVTWPQYGEAKLLQAGG